MTLNAGDMLDAERESRGNPILRREDSMARAKSEEAGTAPATS